MKAFLLSAAIIVAIMTARTCNAQQRVNWNPGEVEAKLNELEARVAALEGKPHHPAGPVKRDGSKMTYAQAYAEAVATGKPLVVWSGSAICPACVNSSQDEFVSFVGTVEGCANNAITVGVPEGGEIKKAAVITTWITDDPVHGHVPSTRRAVTQLKTGTVMTTTSAVMTQSVMQSSMMGSGSCASCGTSQPRGLFRRR